MAAVQQENPVMTESSFVHCYVNGLIPQLKFQLRPLRAVTLTDAYWLAVDIEQGAPAKKQFQQYTSASKTTTLFPKQHTSLIDKPNEFKPPVTTQRAREPGK